MHVCRCCVNEVGQEVLKSQNMLKQAEQINVCLNEKTKELAQHVGILEEQTISLTKELQQTIKDRDEISQEKYNVIDQNIRLQDEKAVLVEQFKSSEIKQEILKAEKEILAKQQQMLQEDMQILLKEDVLLREQLASTLDHLNMSKQDSKQKMHEALSNLHFVQEMLVQTQDDNTRLKKLLDENNKIVNDHHRTLEEKEKLITYLQTCLCDLNEVGQQEVLTLNREKEQLECALELESSINTGELDTAQEENSRMKQILEMKERDLDSAAHNIKEQDKQLAQLRQERDNLISSYQENLKSKEDILMLREKLINHENIVLQRDQLAASQVELLEQINNYRNNLESLQQNNEQLINCHQQLSLKVNDLENELHKVSEALNKKHTQYKECVAKKDNEFRNFLLYYNDKMDHLQEIVVVSEANKEQMFQEILALRYALYELEGHNKTLEEIVVNHGGIITSQNSKNKNESQYNPTNNPEEFGSKECISINETLEETSIQPNDCRIDKMKKEQQINDLERVIPVRLSDAPKSTDCKSRTRVQPARKKSSVVCATQKINLLSGTKLGATGCVCEEEKLSNDHRTAREYSQQEHEELIEKLVQGVHLIMDEKMKKKYFQEQNQELSKLVAQLEVEKERWQRVSKELSEARETILKHTHTISAKDKDIVRLQAERRDLSLKLQEFNVMSQTREQVQQQTLNRLVDELTKLQGADFNNSLSTIMYLLDQLTLFTDTEGNQAEVEKLNKSHKLANALVVLSSTAEDGEIEVRILVG
ncbi:unnamed protein product [Timema podura]|uniref:Uncharacterized protein n=1 Tax=Timema podura TaxID=61482 RepID=A0ABN7NBP9_TIMPD|nr:unnamed protein product [Timema podura]